jgi:hypothetical protein
MELVLHRRYLGKEYTVGSLYFHLSPNPSPQGRGLDSSISPQGRGTGSQLPWVGCQKYRIL